MGRGGDSTAIDDGLWARIRRFVIQDLWQFDLRPRSLRASAVRLLQLCVMIGRGFVRDNLLLRASALTYVTTLSLIPLLVVTVALTSLVGGQEAIIDKVVELVTAVSPEARQLILERIGDVKLGSLGTLGASLLIVTAVLALRHLESTLNEIWGIRTSRSWIRRFSDYLAVLIVAPLLTATAVSLATSIQSKPVVEELLQIELVSQLFSTGLQFLPTLLLMVAFGFLYWFFPNTSVRPLSALLGALVATVLFSIARHLYVDLSLGAARYSVLFGGMAALPLMLAWLYTCWSIVLLGAEVAFAHQNLAHYRQELQGEQIGPAQREAMGLRIAVEIASAFCAHAPPRRAEQLADDLDIPVRCVRELIEHLEDAGLIRIAGDEEREAGYLPACPVRDISVTDVMLALRGGRRSDAFDIAETGAVPVAAAAVDRILEQLDRTVSELGDVHSLADLIEGPPPV
jgi:membrane protein